MYPWPSTSLGLDLGVFGKSIVDGQSGPGGDLVLVGTFFVVVLVGTFASQVSRKLVLGDIFALVGHAGTGSVPQLAYFKLTSSHLVRDLMHSRDVHVTSEQMAEARSILPLSLCEEVLLSY